MAQYDVRLSEISAEMLDELANFAHQAWGRTDILEVDVIPGQPTTQAEPIRWDVDPESALPVALTGGGSTPVAVAVPDPIPASPTGSIEIVLPPEEIEDYKVEEPAPKSTRKRA